MRLRERARIRRQVLDLLARMRYPVKNSGDLAKQINDEKFDLWDATIDFSKVSRNAYLRSFVSERDFPLTDEEDVKRKFRKAFRRFITQELRKLNGTGVPIQPSDDLDDPRDSISLHILRKYDFAASQ